MTTRGHDGLADVLFGSRAEHVVREAGCPVLIAR
jgi:nucleotide-binding universal stress UspA family protein